MELPLTPIKPRRIIDQVFDQIRELVLRGTLKPGEQLMPERELAIALGVSRPTVREAINKLVVMGLLEHKQGQGTFVRSPNDKEKNPLVVAMEAQDAKLEDLLEVRMGLECNAAALAAQRADEKDIRFLEKNIEEMKVEIATGGLGTEADVSFHMGICYASKNPIQVQIMRNFYDFLFYGIRKALQQLYQEPGNLERIIDQHTQIFRAIRERDVGQAEKAMRRHINFVLDFSKEVRGEFKVFAVQDDS
jgi:GntR family transcriptional repressor for pyruvate dehydrogenase complex